MKVRTLEDAQKEIQKLNDRLSALERRELPKAQSAKSDTTIIREVIKEVNLDAEFSADYKTVVHNLIHIFKVGAIVTELIHRDFHGSEGYAWKQIVQIDADTSPTQNKNWALYDENDNVLMAFYTKILGVVIQQLAIEGHVLPAQSNTYNLGASASRWANVYSVLANFSGLITTAITANSLVATNGSSQLIAKTLASLATELEAYFYTEAEIDTMIANKVDKGIYALSMNNVGNHNHTETGTTTSSDGAHTPSGSVDLT